MRELQGLFERPRLRPVLPMLYVAWADGELSDDEINGICETVHPWLDEDCQRQLDLWLDPDDPPSPTELSDLLNALREAADDLEDDDREDLVSMGIELARHDGDGEADWMGPDVERALTDLQEALGWVGPDAVAEITPSEAPAPATHEEPAAFDLEAMSRAIDGRFWEQKRAVRSSLDEAGWEYPVDVPKEERRALVTERLRALAEMGFGEVAYPGVTSDGSLGDFIATFESLAYFDLSLVVKYGVQFGLWGGSVYFLGTEKHHEKYLRHTAAMQLPGCFAMSELGHGSNVRDVETKATYDAETGEFVIHTPSMSARKEWIGNAARDGMMATVFAQLGVDEHEYGVHAFVVPIRDADGEVCDGVTIEDCGHKLGLNGVDNGRIWFDQVRIPRENLLDRYASVDADGGYHSPITSAGKRFFVMLGTLVGGRVAVGSAGLSAAKSALTIAVRYATERRQFGPNDAAEVPIMDYRTHQRRLMPRVATAYALSFAFQDLVDEFLAHIDEEDKREVEAYAAGLKSYATWFANDTIQECREACGGQGYLTSNRFAALRADADIFATFEGDNTVLMQLVAKGRLTQFKNQFGEPGLFSVVRFLAKQAGTAVAERNPYVTRQTDRGHLRSDEFLRAALMYRDEDLVQTLARRFRSRLADDMRPFDALNECQDHFMSVAHAHVECKIYQAFADAVAEIEDDALREQLDRLRALFGVSCLYDDIGWFMEAGYVESAKARAIRSELNELCEETRHQARPLVDAFDIPDRLLSAPIALGEVSG